VLELVERAAQALVASPQTRVVALLRPVTPDTQDDVEDGRAARTRQRRWSRSPQRAEEGADFVHEDLWDLEGGEVAAVIDHGPSMDVEFARRSRGRTDASGVEEAARLPRSPGDSDRLFTGTSTVPRPSLTGASRVSR
jgi:hypothetical protein